MSQNMNPGVGKTSENDYEKYFRWYLEDLKENGYIKTFYREFETFQILPAFKHKREKHFVKKENHLEEYTLLTDIKYTYDFLIVWTKKSENIFYEIFDPNGSFKYGKPLFASHFRQIENTMEIISYVDVKPHQQAARFSGMMASYFTFPFVQKFLMYKFSIYVNKIIPINSGKHGRSSCLFAQSFTPKRYFYTNKEMKPRKITHNPTKTLKAYVQHKLEIINNLIKQEENKSQKSSQKSMDL